MGLVAPILGGLVRFEWQVDDTPWPVHVDAGQLELALMNLIFNARDAMPSRGLSGTRQQPQRAVGRQRSLPGAYVVIASGYRLGTSPGEMLAKVVEPFFTTSRRARATGLGNRRGGYRPSPINAGGHCDRRRADRGPVIQSCGCRVQGAFRLRLSAGAASGRQSARTRQAASDSACSSDDCSSLLELTSEVPAPYGLRSPQPRRHRGPSAVEREPDRFDLIVTDFAMPIDFGLDVIRFARTSLQAGRPVIITGSANAGALAEDSRRCPAGPSRWTARSHRPIRSTLADSRSTASSIPGSVRTRRTRTLARLV